MKDKEERKIAQAEVCVVSYPKSGRTWMRVLLGKALCEQYGLDEQLIFDELELAAAAGLPPMCYTHDDAIDGQNGHYKTLETDKARYENKKVIFLVRDPRDVAVSCYFHASKRRDLYGGAISDFIRDDCFGLRKIVTFYNIWHANRRVPKAFLVLRYEEMHADPAKSLGLALNFIGAPPSEEAIITRAVEYARFDNMKKMEESGYFISEKMRPGKPGDEDSYKVRRGKVGGYADYLSPEDCQYLDHVLHELDCAFFPLDPRRSDLAIPQEI